VVALPGSVGTGWERELIGGAHASVRVERGHRGWKARTKEENIFCGIRQRHARADEGNDGLRKRRARAGKLSQLGWIPRGNSMEKYIFLNFKDF
jgi:hypothetical protein